MLVGEGVVPQEPIPIIHDVVSHSSLYSGDPRRSDSQEVTLKKVYVLLKEKEHARQLANDGKLLINFRRIFLALV